jgi:CheY-like chemotaxis protein
MNSELQKRIFEPFSTTKFLGRGLGLSAVHGILRGHHGTLSIKSLENEGTVITVYLPAIAETAAALATGAAPPATAIQGKVLIVDDEVILQTMVKHMLNAMGYDSFAAGGGDEALRLLANNRDEICLVLLDMTMPGMDGRETYERIKAMWADLPVIISSGYSRTQIRERFGDIIIPILQKPFTLTQLEEKIAEIFPNGV